MKTFKITTLGCKVNQCESEALVQCLKSAGWTPVDGEETADLCIINTCTVTHKASMQSRQAARQAIRRHPEARVLVTGCYAQTEPEAIARIEGVDAIVGHGEKHRIPELVDRHSDETTGEHPATHCPNIGQERTFRRIPLTEIGARTRPFLKIQDGCDAFCTYCIVPHARGRSRSLPPEAVLDGIRALAGSGYHEVVLSGVHLGCYGNDLTPKTDLLWLLKEIDREGDIDRVRISSIEPHELTDGIIDLVAGSNRFCRHFHIPLQSGDDNIVKRMGRPYTRADFGNLVHRIRTQIPDAAIGADVLVGFPGEDDSAFSNTFDLIRELSITYLHVFPFSPRKGTPAAVFSDQVSVDTVKERCRQLRELGDIKKKAFLEGFPGETVTVLVESKRDRKIGKLKGIASNYLTVLFNGADELQNSLVEVKIEAVKGNVLIGAPSNNRTPAG
ncbi:MAG: tRNA (N(6)-L-threonylcarbamoyladenosine(37)-C(2))-methylthiotransferase MtaB [Thermodesulfobacteriota bacterium]